MKFNTLMRTCGANLRSIALANAIRSYIKTEHLLRVALKTTAFANLKVLEINEAGTLSPMLRTFPNYTFAGYPEVDMHELPYPRHSFDLVVHSDTLEHVANPIHALTECHRVLKPSGALAFTVPIVVGRLSRSRTGLPKSYHGSAESMPDDFVVHTEFGADAWTYVLMAGFNQLEIHAVEFPAAIALLAKKASAA